MPVKVIGKVEDDEQVRGRPDMLFVQEQETSTAGEGVSEEVDPRIESAAISHTGCGLEMVFYKSGATDGAKTLLR